MTMPFYVSPEQLMKDRADFARKGIARGRSVVALGFADGIAFATENPSRALHKVSEIYDRIAFAAVGKYNEFENLRVAGIRYADLRGYSYDRADVTARGLANAYAQTLGTAFTTESKPLEVELLVAEVGVDQDADQLYRISYDGSVAEERGVVAMGGSSEALATGLRAVWRPGLDLATVLQMACEALGEAQPRTTEQPEPAAAPAGGAAHAAATAGDVGTRPSIAPERLEVAILERHRHHRAFRRLTVAELAPLLGGPTA